MIHVIASIGVKHGKREEFINIFKDNVPAVLAEDGCIEYIPAVDADSGIEVQWLDESVVTVIEKWETLDALHAHLAAPHMKAFHDQTDQLVEDVSLTILEDV
jgi:quinol monooxygenase YgiN